jgi:hypothetical protein
MSYGGVYFLDVGSDRHEQSWQFKQVSFQNSSMISKKAFETIFIRVYICSAMWWMRWRPSANFYNTRNEEKLMI